jgi:hypothetical protein
MEAGAQGASLIETSTHGNHGHIFVIPLGMVLDR